MNASFARSRDASVQMCRDLFVISSGVISSVAQSHSDAQHSDARLQRLREWVSSLFATQDLRIAPASADASFRRYFRIERGSESFIAMDAPPDKEDMHPYIRVAAMLVDVGVNAPQVLHTNIAEGYLLNTDLGSTTYLAALGNGVDVEPLYQDAMAALLKIQSRGRAHASSLPDYDEALLRREMALFPDWFCGTHLQLRFTDSETAQLAKVYDLLVANALAQPRVLVHRDYHSRNLMLTQAARHGANPGVLDFQDAVNGPLTYDLVSLLRDCYVAWPRERVYAWVAEYRGRARAAGLPAGDSDEEFRRWFDLMGVQRHLKAIGIFARLWHRDGKPGYLNDIPRTLEYVRAVCDGYTELEALGEIIETRVLPAMKLREMKGI
jgi:aminoglycoside/choline kinase family phosphotransferase